MADRLTAKQEKFCQCVAAEMTLSDAYRAAYNTDKMNDQTVWTEASKLAKRDDITERIKTLRKPIVNHYENSVISETRQVHDILWAMVRNENVKDENRLRALDMINRMTGAYRDQTEQDKQDDLSGFDTDKLLDLVKTA